MAGVRSILEKGDLSLVTVASVAKAAEVTERTVYRHYATRDQLLAAFLRWHLEAAGGPAIQDPRSLDTYMVVARRVFEGWQQDEGVVRALYLSPKGRQARKPATLERISRVQSLIDEEIPELTAVERQGLSVAMGALALSENYILMKDVFEMDAAAMGEAMSVAVEMMLTGARSKAAKRKPKG